MKTLGIYASLLIISATGILWYLTSHVHEPEWFQHKTINDDDKYLHTTKLKIKAKVANRDVKTVHATLRRYLKQHKLSDQDKGIFHHIYDVKTEGPAGGRNTGSAG